MNGSNKKVKLTYSKYNIDPVGRVFFWEDKVYRGINKDHLELCNEILGSGLIKELEKKGLFVKTKVSKFVNPDYALVLEHEKIVPTQPTEWTFGMTRDALLALIEVNRVCNKYGFQLKDGHLWNVAFLRNKPIFFDFGSIVKKTDLLSEAFKKEILQSVVALILWSVGEDYLGRKIIENCVTFYKRTIPFSSLTDSKMVQGALGEFLKTDRGYRSGNSPIEFIFANLNRDFIRRIPAPSSGSTAWNDYQVSFFGRAKASGERFGRFDRIVDIIGKYSPDASSALDLAGNMGAMLTNIEKRLTGFNQLINVDYDETAVEKSYLQLRRQKTKVETYLLNFMLPTRDEVRDVLRSDVVLALAITHHLVLTQKYDINFIFESIASYSKKYVYIEFMPLGLYAGDDKETPPVPEWYTEEWFRKKFKKNFALLHEEKLEKNRILFIGKLK